MYAGVPCIVHGMYGMCEVRQAGSGPEVLMASGPFVYHVADN